jgi:hypothetical protein
MAFLPPPPIPDTTIPETRELVPYEEAYAALDRALPNAEPEEASAIQCVLLQILNYVNAGVTADMLDARAWDILSAANNDTDAKIHTVAAEVLAICGHSTNEHVSATASRLYDQLTAERASAVNGVFNRIAELVAGDMAEARAYADRQAERIRCQLISDHADTIARVRAEFDKSVDRKLDTLAFHSKLHAEASARTKAAEALREALRAAEAVKADADQRTQQQHQSVTTQLRHVRQELADRIDKLTAGHEEDAAQLLDACARTEDLARDASRTAQLAERGLQARLEREVKYVRDEIQNALHATAAAHDVELSRLKGDFHAQLRTLRDSIDRRGNSGIIPDTRIDSLLQSVQEINKRIAASDHRMQDAIAAGVTHRISAMERRLQDTVTAAVAPATRTAHDLARKTDELDHRTTQLARTVNQLPSQIDHAVAAAVTAALRPLTDRLDAADNTSATTAQAITQAVAAAMRPFVNRLDALDVAAAATGRDIAAAGRDIASLRAEGRDLLRRPRQQSDHDADESDAPDSDEITMHSLSSTKTPPVLPPHPADVLLGLRPDPRRTAVHT